MNNPVLAVLPVQADAIPQELRDLPQWVLWKGEPKLDKQGRKKINKAPYKVTYTLAASNRPETWTTFDRVVRALPLALEEWEKKNPSTFLGGGIGFVFSAADPYCGIDLDGARDPTTGDIAPWAKDIIEAFDSYTEISVSGTGIHIICRGALPPGRNRKDAIEMYNTGRFFTMSGIPIPPYPLVIHERQAQIDRLHARLFPPAAPKAPRPPKVDLPLTDTDIVQKARTARNGGKFLALWGGDISGYASPSEADAALCSMLAFWTQDAAQIDSLFRASGLYREKWDSRRGNENTYGSQTIMHALENLGERYSGPQQRPARPAVNFSAPPPIRNDFHHPQEMEPAPDLSNILSPQQGQALRCDKEGRPYPDAGNFRTIFTNYQPWKGQLWWDTFSDTPMYGSAPLDDVAITDIAAWCGDALAMSVRSEEQIRRSLYAVATKTPRDPLTEFIVHLEWDARPRLNTWLQQYAGAPDTEATAIIGMTLCCAMVARALTPGGIQRYMVILEGAEDIGKSGLCQILGAPWTRTLSKGMDTKDAQMLLHGCWIMEVPELDSYRRTEESAIKAFLTTTSDTFIPKYANSPRTYERRTVFIGTVNPQGTYLKGQTGNTRFLPVRCVGMIDIQGIGEIRDQLFAEAKTLIEEGYQWWKATEKSAAIIDEREQRREVDIYESLIQEWLEASALHESGSYVTMEEILRQALKMTEPERWKDRALVTQVGNIVHRLGWTRKKIREGKITRWVYLK